MKNVIFAMLMFIILIIAACSKKTSPGKTAETPKVKATTYTVDVLPIMQMKCTPCHLPTKGGFKTNFENFASAQKFGAEMVIRIERNPGEKGFMPFKQPEKLTAEEIAVFKKWVSDGLLEK